MGCNTLDSQNRFNQNFSTEPLLICDQFVSIQGEGRDSGAHALFIRLAGCNLKCEWCDTKNSWLPGVPWTQLRVLKKLRSYRQQYRNNYIVWTGGEPLLQELKLYSIIEQTKDYYHMLETNGTIIPEKPHLFNAIAVSPKQVVPGSWKFDGKRWLTIRNAYIKLVVDDIKEARDFQSRYDFPCQWFFVMTKTMFPFNLNEYIEKEKKIFRGCIEEGFNYSPRLQLYFEAK